MVLVDITVLLIGFAVVGYFADKTVGCSTCLAHRLKVPPLLIGILLVSVGTDIPEIANSVFSSWTNHGDINVGDTMGSALTQITLVFGLAVLIGGSIVAKRRNILVLGACATAAVLVAAFLVSDGTLDRIDAVILILTYAALLVITGKFTSKEARHTRTDRTLHACLSETVLVSMVRLGIYLFFIVVGAALIVETAINLSYELGLPEYLVSFFIVAIGTSVPELSVEITALRQKKYGLMLGDLFGSNITDATLALGLGPLLFPTDVSSGIIMPLATYVVIASAAVVGLFLWRRKVDRWSAVVFVGVYLLSLAFV
jgi:cation:H+ antiporter